MPTRLPLPVATFPTKDPSERPEAVASWIFDASFFLLLETVLCVSSQHCVSSGTWPANSNGSASHTGTHSASSGLLRKRRCCTFPCLAEPNVFSNASSLLLMDSRATICCVLAASMAFCLMALFSSEEPGLAW